MHTTNKEPVVITQFKWAGRLGPFHIKTSCNECDLTTAILLLPLFDRDKLVEVVNRYLEV
jgi:hypothetical protein